MSEKDFWTKYFRADFLLKTKNSQTAEAEAAEDDELAIFLKKDDILAREAHRKVFFLYYISLKELEMHLKEFTKTYLCRFNVLIQL